MPNLTGISGCCSTPGESSIRKLAANGLREAAVPTPLGEAAQRLAAEGHRVRAMSRSSSTDQKIRAVGAEPIQCDLDAVIAADLRGYRHRDSLRRFVEQWGLRTPRIALTCKAPGACSALPSKPAARRFIHIGRCRKMA